MREGHRLLAAIAAVSLAAAAGACASGGDTATGGAGGGPAATSSSSSSSGSTSTSSTGGAGGTGGGGQGGGSTNGCKATDDVVLAVDRLYFGDTNWDDSQNTSTGWQNFGLDIDGLSSTGSSTDTCKAAFGGAPAQAFPDGPNGIDNSFGKNVLPVFLQSIPTLSSQANAALVNGDFSILIRLLGLGAQSNVGSLPAKVYGGAYLPVPPLFDGSDCWPATADTLTDPTDVESAKLTFPSSTVTSNHWDSVGTGDLVLRLKVLSFQGSVAIHHARVVMDLDPSHDGTQHGIISGILDTEELVNAINQLMGQFDPSQCGGTLQAQIDVQIRQSSDIMKDGTQNPNATCDGISVGLGFKAARVEFGPIGPALAPDPMPCP